MVSVCVCTLCVCVHVHVGARACDDDDAGTPRQWHDRKRSWVADEKNRMLALARQVCGVAGLERMGSDEKGISRERDVAHNTSMLDYTHT